MNKSEILIEKYKNILNDSNSGTIIISTPENLYQNKKLYSIFKCKCGTTFTREMYIITKDKLYYCSGKNCKNIDTIHRSHNRITDDELDIFMKKSNIKTYTRIEKNGSTYVRQICQCGKEFDVILNSIKNKKYKSLCKDCAQSLSRTEMYDINTFENKFKTFIEEKGSTLLSPYISATDKISIKCSTCNSTLEQIPNYVYYWKSIQCQKCRPSGISISEKEVFNFIKNIYDDTHSNDRKLIYPKELDIVAGNIAVEYDGLYWHKNQSKLHLDKTEKCEEKGIQLFHVFENEWKYKQHIWKSVLSSKLGKTDRTIFARKCTIKLITAKEINIFCEQNHLQGFAR